MTMPNLRAAITQVTRGGRSGLSRRYCSSSGDNAERIEIEYIGASAFGKLMGFCTCFAIGYVVYDIQGTIIVFGHARDVIEHINKKSRESYEARERLIARMYSRREEKK